MALSIDSGPFRGSHWRESPNNLGSVVGPLIFENSHISKDLQAPCELIVKGLWVPL